jgi:type VI secretion system secreted protein Hcp
MAIYLKYEGIDGDTTEHKHMKWIEVMSVQFGVGRAISTRTGAAHSRESSEPSVSEVTIVKQLDASTPKLFVESCTGNKGKKVEIEYVTTGQESEVPLRYELTDVLVSGYSISSSGDRPTESVSLNFTKVEMKYTPYNAKHEPGTPVTVSYDLAGTKTA